MTHRIIIVDDHPLFRSALRQILETGAAGYTVGEAGEIEGLTAALEADRDCDLVLLDLNMPGVRGFSGLLLLRAQFPEVPVMIVSAVEDTLVISRCLELGASGYLSKSEPVDRIRAAIETVLEGGRWIPEGMTPGAEDDQSAVLERLATLTPQQIRVLMMLSDGLMNKQIAYALDISEATVKAHVSAILQKLGVDSRTQAVIAASKIEQGQFSQLVDAS
ncbi:response regulator [Pelagibacterium montanilacus]|uniref:response regulator n=1 Tax=Pelagibacterium montanilacus TaxID=2185280 RepID=UPI000F8F0D6C|nr:response regulator transcription factor [Pelagibacterium montanilacus]